MKTNFAEEIQLPPKVEATLDGKTVRLKGEKGEVAREYPFPNIGISKHEGKILLNAENASKREKKQLFTIKAHLKNQIKGVTQGHTYLLKICSGHFPMSVSVKDNALEIKNFIGEKVPRSVKLKQGVHVKIDGELIEVSGIDKELVSQTAARIEQLTRRPGYDRRIFQDGIYITEKDGKKIR
jgi:large subunit ribosomal protein L6